MMTGVIRSIPSKDGRMAPYAFIKGKDGVEYFLHASELFEGWDRLKATIALKQEAILQFESTMGEKGPRAVAASILNGPAYDEQ